MIVLDTQNNVFTLHTKHTTYQMKADQYRVLLHTYYGPRVSGGDLSYLIQFADRGASPNPNEAGHRRDYSLETLPQEYSTCGVGDFRLPSIELELPNGSHSADLRYQRYELQKGKYPLPGLPAFYSGEKDAETLILYLEDAAAQVTVKLYYGVFEEFRAGPPVRRQHAVLPSRQILRRSGLRAEPAGGAPPADGPEPAPAGVGGL